MPSEWPSCTHRLSCQEPEHSRASLEQCREQDKDTAAALILLGAFPVGHGQHFLPTLRAPRKINPFQDSHQENDGCYQMQIPKVSLITTTIPLLHPLPLLQPRPHPAHKRRLPGASRGPNHSSWVRTWVWINSSLLEQWLVFFPHSPFCLLFLSPKAKHTGGHGEKCQVHTQRKIVFPSVSIRTVEFSPLSLGRSHSSSFSLRPTGVAQGHPTRRFPENGAQPIPQTFSWQLGGGTSFAPWNAVPERL